MLKKERHAAAKLSELTPDTGKTVQLGREGECTLFLHNGRVYAVGSLCPHQNAPLDGAPAEAGAVVCRRHGYRFRLTNGGCLTLGGYGIPCYPVDIEGDAIYVTCWEEG